MVLERSVVTFPDNEPLGIGIGNIILENQTEDVFIDVRELIEEEILGIDPGDFDTCSAYWGLSIRTLTVPGSVSGFGGNPPRYKLGNVTFASVENCNDFVFWNWLQQSFPMQGCIVSPSGYAGTATRIEDLSEFQAVNLLKYGIGGNGNGFFDLSLKSYKSPASLFGNTAFGIYLDTPGIVYNLSIAYICGWDVFIGPSGFTSSTVNV